MKIDERNERNWNPKRKGNIYCSPGCGKGCTIQEYNKALNKAKKTAKLLGKGWTFNVYENLGWFFDVRFDFDINNHITVSHNYTENYTAQFNNTYMYFYNKDPRKAISALIKKMKREFTNEIRTNTKILNIIEEEKL